MYPFLEDYHCPACNPTAIPTVFRGLHSSSLFILLFVGFVRLVFVLFCLFLFCLVCFVSCFLFDCRLPLSQAQARSRFIFIQLLLKLRFFVHPDSKLQVPLDRQM